MGGFFGVVSTDDCVKDVFYGTDYHSHLGTKRGGMAVINSSGIKRSIHNIQNNYFRTKFEPDLPKFTGRLAGRPEGGVAGHVSFGPGALRFGDAPELPVGTQINLVIHQGLLTVLGARIIGEGTNVAYRGRLRLSGRPQGPYTVKKRSPVVGSWKRWL